MTLMTSLLKFFPGSLAANVFGCLLSFTKSICGRKNTEVFSSKGMCRATTTCLLPKAAKTARISPLQTPPATGRLYFTDCDSDKINIWFSNLQSSYQLGEEAHTNWNSGRVIAQCLRYWLEKTKSECSYAFYLYVSFCLYPLLLILTKNDLIKLLWTSCSREETQCRHLTSVFVVLFFVCLFVLRTVI